MKKFYYNLLFALLSAVSAQAQVTISCGDSGTSITVNEFSADETGSSQCGITYDMTLTAAEVGIYTIKVSTIPVLTFDIDEPGIFNFSGAFGIFIPCISITYFSPVIRLVTPSGEVCLVNLGSLLPVTYTSFSVAEEEGKAVLRWATATELNNEGFFIEHARNGDDWQSIGFTAGVGTTNEPQNYEFVAENLPAGDHYFRLKQVDHDGSFAFSEVANLYLEGPDGPLRIFPNPVRRGQQLSIKGGFDQAEIYSLTGQRLMSIQQSDDLSAPQFTDLPAGMYHLRVQRHGKTLTEKLVIH
jgi:hypothetical protein